jgi:signal transduction histidine kinase
MSTQCSRSSVILHSMAELQARVRDIRHLPEVYDRVVQIASTELQAELVVLFLWNESHNHLEVVASAGAWQADTKEIPVQGTLPGWAVSHAQPLLVHIAEDSGEPVELLRATELDAAAVIPVYGLGRVIGVLLAGKQNQATPFTASDACILNVLAHQTALLFEKAHLHTLTKHDYEEQERHIDQLVQAEKLAGMGRLVAAIAHEINNPLHAIYNSLHLLQNRPLSDEKRERYLAMTQEQVERLIGLVQRILNFYQPSRDGMRPTAIHPLLSQVLRAVAEQTEHNGISIEREWAQGLPRVMGVASHLRHVFQHLTLNAIEAMPQGGHLLVRTRVVPGEPGSTGQFVQIDFSDDGSGISDSEIHMIFEPFFTTKRRGTGLGLAVSYGIVERHGGVLSAHTDGTHTIFRITLPTLDELTLPDEEMSVATPQRVQE